MCYRYGRFSDINQIAVTFEIPWLMFSKSIDWDDYVLPDTTQPTIKYDTHAKARKLTAMRWGLVPSFSNGDKGPYTTARSETLGLRRSFLEAFKERRCVVPANLYYQWQFSDPEADGSQQWVISLGDSQLFGMAGIWESVDNKKTGERCERYAILTTQSNDSTQVTNTRMPVILPQDDYDRWLAPSSDVQSLLYLLKPFAKPLQVFKMSKPIGELQNVTIEYARSR